MIQLLFSEVEIVPGVPGMFPPGRITATTGGLKGSAVVRVQNQTQRQNAFTIQVTCDHPFWLTGWHALKALDAPPTGAQDQYGAQDQSVTVYVGKDESRDILIRFDVPALPEARAGRFRYQVQVTQAVLDGNQNVPTTTTRSAEAIIRPFYKWSVDVTPEERKTWLVGHKGDYDLVVTNEGNDWLYCNLLPLPPQDKTQPRLSFGQIKPGSVEFQSLRVAVRPPEPNEMLPDPSGLNPRPGTQRQIPLRAVTGLRKVFGSALPQAIVLNATRIDAPSVPPPPAPYTARQNSVVGVLTGEKSALPPGRSLIYLPFFGNILTIFSAMFGRVQALAMFALGLAVLFVSYHFVYANFIRAMKIGTTQDLKVGKNRLIGEFLTGAEITFLDKNGKPLQGKNGALNGSIQICKPDSKHIGENSLNGCLVDIPPEMDHLNVKIRAKRAYGWLSFLCFTKESEPTFQIGNELAAPTESKILSASPNPCPLGALVTITGTGLETVKSVIFNGNPVGKIKSRSDTMVVVQAPDKQTIGGLALLLADNKSIEFKGTFSVQQLPAAENDQQRADENKGGSQGSVQSAQNGSTGSQGTRSNSGDQKGVQTGSSGTNQQEKSPEGSNNGTSFHPVEQDIRPLLQKMQNAFEAVVHVPDGADNELLTRAQSAEQLAGTHLGEINPTVQHQAQALHGFALLVQGSLQNDRSKWILGLKDLNGINDAQCYLALLGKGHFHLQQGNLAQFDKTINAASEYSQAQVELETITTSNAPDSLKVISLYYLGELAEATGKSGSQLEKQAKSIEKTTRAKINDVIVNKLEAPDRQ